MLSRHKQSPLKIFAPDLLITALALVVAVWLFGVPALLTTLILIIIEVTFSFDNAIINAKILERLSRPWQVAFLTIGILIAVIGMRLLFPIVIVSLSAGLGFSQVVDLALNHPTEYSQRLSEAHVMIASFGGAFLLMLALGFFFDRDKPTTWLHLFERPVSRLGNNWWPSIIVLLVVASLSSIAGQHGRQILEAGIIGIGVYLIVHLGSELLNRRPDHHGPATGWAALMLFVYLQVIDASFSFDGVIGAFAITNDVVLIALGLGVGALWVRSMTIFMVHRGTLKNYIYLEHGAHYTIAVLAIAMFVSLFWHLPEAITGLIGIGIIGSSIAASLQAKAQA
ncbi:MAG TPA: DUF475 domain-containing protein [Candidatus Saccharimonadales bacterium]|nr:DUF475 domain-containing protein [Candidatus Saccharimonadales bacterium]